MNSQSGSEGRISNSRLYTGQVLAEYLSIRKDLDHITPDLLRVFA